MLISSSDDEKNLAPCYLIINMPKLKVKTGKEKFSLDGHVLTFLLQSCDVKPTKGVTVNGCRSGLVDEAPSVYISLSKNK